MKYIFFDIDNTIYSLKENRIRESIIELFKKLHYNGYKLGVATGRNNSNLEILDPIKEYLDYYVLSNGMYVKDKFNSIIYQNVIPKDAINIIYNIYQSSPEFYLGFGAPSWRAFIDKKPENVKRELDVIKYHDIKFDEIETLWLVSLNQDLINKKYQELINNKLFKIYNWNHYGLDIVLNNHGKETGVKHILEQNNDCELLVSVGDGDNDLKLMQMANFGIAIKTTTSKLLLDTAKYHVSSVDTDELYELFKKLDFIS